MCVIYNDGPGTQTFCDACTECESLRAVIRADFEDANIPLGDEKGNQWKVNFAPDGLPDGSISLL